MNDHIILNNNAFQSFFKENTLPMVLVSPKNLEILDANKKAQDFLGLPESSYGIAFSSISAIEPDLFNDAIRSFYEKGYSGLELPFKDSEGAIRDIELHFTLTTIESDQFLLNILVDVSDRNRAIRAIREGKETLAVEVKRQTADLLRINNSLIEQIKRRRQAEDELRQSEAMFFRLFQFNPTGMILVDLNSFTITEVNQSLLNTLGVQKADLLLKMIDQTPLNQSKEEFGRIRKILLNSKEVQQEAKVISTAQGFPCHVLFSAEIIKLEKGDFMLQVYQDITELQRAQQQVTLSERRFRSMIENNTDIILIIDDNGKAHYISPSVSKVLGYEQSSPQRRPNILSFINTKDRLRLRAALHDMREGYIYTYSSELKIPRRNGQLRTYEFTASNMLADQSVAGVVVNARDITEKNIAREEIKNALNREQELSHQKTQFISTVSHEFRTPLSNISLNIQLLNKYIGQQRTDKASQSLKRMDNAVKRLTNLLNEASLVSKDQSGRLMFNAEEIDSDDFITYLLDQFSYLMLPNVVVKIEKEDPKRILVDRNLIAHIISNLLSNAIKFTPEKQTIIFQLTLNPEENLKILIRDSGIGIPEREIKFLFDPYFRASNVKQVGGTGLGLSIVKRCVDLHGGEIKINSKEGEGTEVLCTIPLSLSVGS